MLLLDLEKVNATVGPGEAVMNTLIGMGTVFVVLILIYRSDSSTDGS